jgi:uncharacterized protein
MELYIMIAAAAVGGFLQSSTGFGYSLICMTIYSYFLPIKIAIVLQAFVAMFTIAYYTFLQFKHINFKLFIIPALFSLVTTYIGTELVYVGSEEILRRVLGVTFILLTVASVTIFKKIKISKGIGSMFVAGSVSGLIGGLTNLSGPPMVIYYLQVTSEKNEYNGTIQAFFLVNTVFKTIINAANGLITTQIISMTPLLLVGTAIGSYFGIKLFRSMNMNMIKMLVNTIMIFVGLYYTFIA